MPSTAQANDFPLTNYVAYRDPKALDQPRIGHLDLEKSLIQPLSFASGTPLSNLYQVIEVGESQIKAAGELIALSSVHVSAIPCDCKRLLSISRDIEILADLAISKYVRFPEKDSTDLRISCTATTPHQRKRCSCRREELLRACH
jgi:hypothetical protein